MLGLHGDRGGVVVGWFTKIAIILALVGLAGFEATSIGVTHVSAQDLAKAAAREGSREWQQSHDVQKAYDAAEIRALEDKGTIKPDEFIVAQDGSVTVTVQREASSLILYRFGATKKWTQVRETATGKYVG